MVTRICLHYTLFRDRTGPNVAQNPKGTNVSVFCGADIAYLPTPKLALGPLDSRPEGSRTNFERERGKGRGRGIRAPYTILKNTVVSVQQRTTMQPISDQLSSVPSLTVAWVGVPCAWAVRWQTRVTFWTKRAKTCKYIHTYMAEFSIKLFELCRRARISNGFYPFDAFSNAFCTIFRDVSI